MKTKGKVWILKSDTWPEAKAGQGVKVARTCVGGKDKSADLEKSVLR